MTLARDALDLARKDLTVEFRTRRSTVSTATVAGASLVLVGLLVGPSPERLRDVAPAVAWIALLYAAIAVADRIEALDRTDDVFSALWLVLDDRRAVYLGRVISLTVLLTLLHLAIWAGAVVLLNLNPGPAAVLIVPLSALAAIAASAAIAIVSPLVAASAERVLLLPVLLVPLLVPTFLAGVRGSTAVIDGNAAEALPWAAALAVQAALLAGVGLLTYDEAARPG